MICAFLLRLAIACPSGAVLSSLQNAFTYTMSLDSPHPRKDAKWVELGSLTSSQVVLLSRSHGLEGGEASWLQSRALSRAPLQSQEPWTDAGVPFKEQSDNIWDSTCGSLESIKGLGAERPGKNYLQLCYSICGPPTSNTWELVINAESQALPWMYWIRTCLLTRSLGDSQAQ